MRCPACSELIAEQSRFCPNCGFRASSHGDERRIITVVFADVVGFTTLSEHRDPEQVKHLVDTCFQWLVEDIVSFGGRVDKIIGDAVLALFGAPIAHEDDAERGVRAALRMQETVTARASELDGAVRLRIGVNSGEVLVGALHAGGDYTAMGDVVNTADRLQAAAQPGEVLVGVSTMTSTRNAIAYDVRGIVPAKGLEAPLRAWIARAPTSEPGERSNRSTGPLVGRANEVAVLTTAAGTALANDRASLQVLLGDAGMGKSRISAEVSDALRVRHRALVLEGRCLPYGEVNVWWPVADALCDAIGVAVGEPLEVIEPLVRDLVAATSDVALDDPDVVRVSNGLLQLFGFEETRRDLDPTRSRDEVVRSVVKFLDATTSRRPVVIRLSDVHWADDVVLDMLGVVMTALSRRPLVVLVSARRSLLTRWTPPVGRFDTFALNLEALDAKATDQLIDVLVEDSGARVLGYTARSELRERSGGNPLFLIELLALLDEERTGATGPSSELDVLGALPETLRGLVAARLDNLGPRERAVIDDAAVLGRRGRVEHLSEMSLHLRGDADVSREIADLTARDLLRVEDGVWEFRSDPTREVAYAMLTKSDRADKHLGVARWIEAGHSETWSDRTVDALAHHYGQAAELLGDLGTVGQLSNEVRDRALHWILEVSGRGERLRLNPAVERLCSQGLELADDTQADVRLTLLLRRARARIQAHDATGAGVDVDAARTLSTELGDTSGEAAILVLEGDLAQQAGEVDTARERLGAAVDLYESLGDDAGAAEALRAQGMVELFAGNFVDAESSTQEALVVFRRLERRSGEAWALQNLAWMAFVQGRMHEAEGRLVESLALFDALGDSGGTVWARGLQGFMRLQDGELAAAEEVQRSVIDDAQSSGDHWATAMMLMLGSMVNLWTGRIEASITDGRAGLDMFRSIQDRFGQVRIAWALSRALVTSGKVAEGFATLDALEPIVSSGTDDDRTALTVARASLEVLLGRPQRALDALGWMIERDAGSSSHHEAYAAVGGVEALAALGMARLQSGDADDAQRMVDRAAAVVEGDGVSAQVLVVSVFARLLVGDVDEAMTMIDQVLGSGRATYLDRYILQIASGLVAARRGDVDAVLEAFELAHDTLDSTQDVVSKAILALAESLALAAVGAPDSSDRSSEARRRFHALEVDGAGWRSLFNASL